MYQLDQFDNLDLKWADAHSHLIWPNMKPKLRDIILNAYSKGIELFINCSTNLEDEENCKNLSNQFRYIKSTYGIHPMYSLTSTHIIDQIYSQLIEKGNNFSAIGEIGLDYFLFRNLGERKKCQTLFESQLRAAAELQMPIVVHCRDAEKKAIEILQKSQYNSIPKILFHTFSGSKKSLKKIIDHSEWYVSIPSTVLNMKNYQRITRDCPLERMMLESDSPFIPPIAKWEINQPISILLAAPTIAKIKGCELGELARNTFKNCYRFFI